MSTAQSFTTWLELGREGRLEEYRRLIELAEEVKARESKRLARANVEAIQEWLEQQQEDRCEMTPEFAAAIERGKADLAEGRHRTVRP